MELLCNSALIPLRLRIQSITFLDTQMDGTRSQVHETLGGSVAAMREMALKQDFRIAKLNQNIDVRIFVCR